MPTAVPSAPLTSPTATVTTWRSGAPATCNAGAVAPSASAADAVRAANTVNANTMAPSNPSSHASGATDSSLPPTTMPGNEVSSNTVSGPRRTCPNMRPTNTTLMASAIRQPSGTATRMPSTATSRGRAMTVEPNPAKPCVNPAASAAALTAPRVRMSLRPCSPGRSGKSANAGMAACSVAAKSPTRDAACASTSVMPRPRPRRRIAPQPRRLSGAWPCPPSRRPSTAPRTPRP